MSKENIPKKNDSIKNDSKKNDSIKNDSIKNDSKETYMNGGFPPIRYCKPNETNKNKSSKERFFSTSTRNDMNIRQILNTKSNSSFIKQDNDNNDLEIIDEL